MQQLQVHNFQTDGLLRHFLHCAELGREYFTKEKNLVLTIAWNKGKPQQVNIDGQVYPLPTLSVITLTGYQSYQFEYPEEIIAWQFNREFYCIIDHDKEVSCVGLLFYGADEVPIIHLDAAEQHTINLLQQVFIDEFAHADNLQEDMLRMLLKRLIIKITRLYKKQNELEEVAEEELDVVRHFNLLVEQHYKKWHQVQDYANEMHKSPKTLSNIFNQAHVPSPLKIIHERIVLEAKRLLIYTDFTIKEIAFELGFEQVPPFNRLFKKVTQQTPTQFKNTLK